MTTPAQAMPAGLSKALSAGAPNLVEKTQFMWEGRNYCFYLDGWHGPGWYWCGYSHRRGRGWGGPQGWHNWHHGGKSHHRGNRGNSRHMGKPSHMGKPGQMGKSRHMDKHN